VYRFVYEDKCLAIQTLLAQTFRFNKDFNRFNSSLKALGLRLGWRARPLLIFKVPKVIIEN
jgi:hypothetical protein